MKTNNNKRYNKGVTEKDKPSTVMSPVLRSADTNGIPGIEDVLFPGGTDGEFAFSFESGCEDNILGSSIDKEGIL